MSEKLRSRRGASLLLALAVFLVCALAGTAALGAASSDAGRLTHVPAEEQEYLTASSAIELLRGGELVGAFSASFCYSESYRWWWYDAPEGPRLHREAPVRELIPGDEPPALTGVLGEALTEDIAGAVYGDLMEKLGLPGEAAPEAQIFEFTIRPEHDMGEVSVTLTMRDGYAFLAEARGEGGLTLTALLEPEAEFRAESRTVTGAVTGEELEAIRALPEFPGVDSAGRARREVNFTVTINWRMGSAASEAG